MEGQALLSLAEIIQKDTKAIADHLKTQDGREPDDMPKNMAESRSRLHEAAKELYEMTSEPYDHLMNLAWDYHNVSSLRWILHFRIPRAVPLYSSITYTSLAKTCVVNETDLRRIIRFCITNQLFHENPEDDSVSHSRISAALLQNKTFTGGLEYITEEVFPISAKLVEAHENWSENQQTAYGVAWNTHLTPYEFMSLPGNEERFRKFKGCMSFLHDDPAQDLQHAVTGYAWETATTVIDIGGSVGEVAIALAKAHPHLKIIVQDLADAVTNGRAILPPELKDRVSFQEHDFFTPQPPSLTTGEEVYFMRFILHNWPDDHAANILRSLLPGLKAGAKLLIMDILMPTPGSVSKALERYMRQLDLEMMQQFGGIERSREQWESLFSSVDEKLVLKNMVRPEGSLHSLLEVVYE